MTWSENTDFVQWNYLTYQVFYKLGLCRITLPHFLLWLIYKLMLHVAVSSVFIQRNGSQCFIVVTLISSSQTLKGIYCSPMASLLQHTAVYWDLDRMINCDDTFFKKRVFHLGGKNPSPLVHYYTESLYNHRNLIEQVSLFGAKSSDWSKMITL